MLARAEERSLAISRASTARLLGLIVRVSGARHSLEVGTGLGRATLALAAASEDMRVTTVDRDSDVQQAARGLLARAGVADRVTFLAGEAKDVLPTLEGPYDLVFLDVDKADDRRCLDLALQLLKVNGVVLVEHLLCDGLVAEPGDDEDDSVEAAYAFNGYFSSHPQLSALVLPVDDGLGVAVKLRPLVTDLGGPF